MNSELGELKFSRLELIVAVTLEEEKGKCDSLRGVTVEGQYAAAGNSDINYLMTLPADSARSDMSATSWRPRSEAVGVFSLKKK